MLGSALLALGCSGRDQVVLTELQPASDAPAASTEGPAGPSPETPPATTQPPAGPTPEMSPSAAGADSSDMEAPSPAAPVRDPECVSSVEFHGLGAIADNYMLRWTALDASSRYAYWTYEWSGNDVRVNSFRWTAEGGVQILATEDAEEDMDLFFSWVSRDGRTVFGTTLSESGDGQGFRWSEATGMARLDFLPSVVTPDGQVAAGFRERVPVLWREGVGATEIDPAWSAMSPDLGRLRLLDGGAVILASHSSGQTFRWSAATGSRYLTDIDLISGTSRSADVLFGFIGGGGKSRAVRWTEQSGLQDLGDMPGAPAGARSEAMYGSDDGKVIIGQVWLDSFFAHAFRWTEATGMLDITPGARNARPAYVSPDGEVVIGTYSEAGSSTGGFRWTAATGAVDVADTSRLGIGADGDLIVGNSRQGWSIQTFGKLAGTTPELVRLQPQLVPSGWSGVRLDGVSRDGRLLVGNGINPAGQREAWLLHLRQSCPGD